MKEYGIAELSKLAGVSARTLRYYDEIGLLKPRRVNEAGYRFYGEKEVNLLWQILFYRERGLELAKIRRILTSPEYDVAGELEHHLKELEREREHLDILIRTVAQTIASMKGEDQMSDQKKFEAFKKELVENNESAYGEEIRRKYGDENVDLANQRRFKLSEEEYRKMTELEAEILSRLNAAVRGGENPESETGREISSLHRSWLGYTWPSYIAKAHCELAKMYTADERFTAYYDREVVGCAEFLKDAILHWC